ncbi:Sterol-binding [Shewanella piezotolerans WP3]|uniref:Ubiquinone biosynthesis accessory factor UbiT n=1 Tax=Shewanella piezotolerans (strain WP3 / JCM 13877) TaxID=225849 RepID=B8CKL6_SHEPW|nr:SCP2 sterol-binding domain-containing protein [Shewanella piezotolerans]ACJ28055.1 Sterol-binding [Shewanella piezotolerans WP3]
MQGLLPNSLAKKILNIGPKALSQPLALIPFSLKADLLKRILTLMLAEQAKDDELEFLQDRWVAIEVEDLALTFEVSYNGSWLVRSLQNAEVTFKSDSKALLLVAAAKEDPDTLFFQRKLSIEGDTELGLEVKNLLLGVEFDSMPTAISTAVTKLAEALQSVQKSAELQVA